MFTEYDTLCELHEHPMFGINSTCKFKFMYHSICKLKKPLFIGKMKTNILKTLKPVAISLEFLLS